MSIVFWPLFTSICFNLKSRKLMLPALHFFIPSVLQTGSCLSAYLLNIKFSRQIIGSLTVEYLKKLSQVA